jgi:uncharacterized membrane protein
VRRQLAILGLAFVSTFWLVALATAPRWATGESRAGTVASAFVYLAGSIICHQRPDRSFHDDGAQLPVCARCTGLYAGAMAGVLGWAVLSGLGRTARSVTKRFTELHRVRLAIVIAALPTIASLASEWSGWWEPGNMMRATLGLPLGAVVAACIVAVGASDMS